MDPSPAAPNGVPLGGGGGAASAASTAFRSAVIKEGWVQKRGEYIRNWRPRYMMLYSDGQLLGFKERPCTTDVYTPSGVLAPGEEPPVNDFNLSFCHVRQSEKSGGLGFSFTISLMQVSHWIERHLSVESAEERQSWIEKINSINVPQLPADDDTVTNAAGDRQNTECQQVATSNDAAVKLENFEMLKVLGQGSFGKVMLVREKSSGDYFAMKILKKAVLMRKNEVSHTITEKRVLQSVRHPFLTQLKYAFQTPDRLFFIMEYVHGGELFYHLGQERSHMFSESKTRFYTGEIILGVEHLHLKNIIYRDIKLENIMIDHEGHIKITDFGLCKQAINERNGATTFCGTPEYLAPEVIALTDDNGDDDVVYGHAVDWWALGIVVYEMLFGRLPFFDQNQNRQELYRRIREVPVRFPSRTPASPEARSLLTGLLEKDPRLRLGSRRGVQGPRDLKAHEFFQTAKGWDWDLLLARQMPPPFIPRQDGDYFDRNFTSQPVSLTPPTARGTLAHDPFQTEFD